MGAKTWMLAHCDQHVRASDVLSSYPELDRQGSHELAMKLFPSAKLEPIADGDLSYTCPIGEEIYVGCFPGLSIVAASEFGLDYPSRLDPRFLELRAGDVYLHAMHSTVDWFAYAILEEGELKRALSLSPDSGILEDVGERRPFETPFWSGQRSPFLEDEEDVEYPFPFHPLELGEAALLYLFGYVLEGEIDPSQIDPERVRLAGFRRKKPWWKFW